MAENTDATELTRPKRTDDGTTPRATHLARLEALVDWMHGEQEVNAGIVAAIRAHSDESIAEDYQKHADSLAAWAESLRCLIEDRS